MRVATKTFWLVNAALVLALSAAAPNTARGEPNCTCRYAGQSYALNTCVCIVTPGGARMACCNLVLNNTSWTFTDDGCPVADAPERTPDRTLARLGRPRPPAQEIVLDDRRRIATAVVSGDRL